MTAPTALPTTRYQRPRGWFNPSSSELRPDRSRGTEIGVFNQATSERMRRCLSDMEENLLLLVHGRRMRSLPDRAILPALPFKSP